MKKLPDYLENILNLMAESEEETGGMKKDEAYKLFKKELIEESLTAKVNPSPAAPLVVVIEDEPDLRSLYLMLLKTFGYRAEAFPSWESTTIPPDAIVLHDMQGVGEKPANLPNRCISMSEDPETKPDLEKPFRPEKLEAMLKSLANPAKFDRCVEAVKESSPDSNAYAVCTKSVGRKKNPAVKTVIDQLHTQGKSTEEIHSYLSKNGYRASKVAIENYIKKNPRKSAGHSRSEFDPAQIARGAKVEMEHTDDQGEAEKIAMDHLVEDPAYYDKLATIHAEENPTKQVVDEMIEVYRPQFEISELGKNLSPEQREEVWHELEIFVKKIINPIMKYVFRIDIADPLGKRPEGKTLGHITSGLMKSQKRALGLNLITRKEYLSEFDTPTQEDSRVEFNRYHKLYIMAFLNSIFMGIFNVRQDNAIRTIAALELGKTYKDLRKYRNRLNFVVAIDQGMKKLSKNNSTADRLEKWVTENAPTIIRLNKLAEIEAVEEKKKKKEEKPKKVAPLLPTIGQEARIFYLNEARKKRKAV